jgi:uncharacterized membrane protein
MLISPHGAGPTTLRGLYKAAVRHPRLLLGMIAGLGIFTFAPPEWSLLARVLMGWNGGTLLFLVLVYIWMFGLDSKGIHARYQEGDPTAPVILLVVTVAALASIAAIVALLATVKHFPAAQRTLHVALAAATIVDSWILVATMFTIHYANLFYRSVDDPPLRFPETARPIFWDFIYFSFTIAAACQTSDVLTTQASIRRVVAAQTLVAFLFNLSILGFAVNVSAGLLGE